FDQPINQIDITPEHAGLHCAYRIPADDLALWRLLDRHTRQLGRRFMQRFHGEVDPGGDNAAFEARIFANDIKGGRCAGIDHDQRALVERVRADGVDQAVRAYLAGFCQADGDADLDILSNHEGLDIEITARQVALVE